MEADLAENQPSGHALCHLQRCPLSRHLPKLGASSSRTKCLSTRMHNHRKTQMQDLSHSSPHHSSALEEAFKGIAQSVATSIVEALVEPLRLEIECKVNALIAEATQDVHAKIAAALGQIQPFNIPINLFAQPLVQPLQSAPAVSATTALPTPQAVQATVPAAPAALSIKSAPQPKQVKTPAAKVVAPTPPQALERADQEEDKEDLLALIRSDKARTPKRSSKNFAATIVGLMPGQAHMIKKEFKFAKFSFVSADARNSSQLISLAKNNNKVIFMTDFIRHAAVDTVRAANGHWIYVSGGMSTLREKIQELHEQHHTEQAAAFG